MGPRPGLADLCDRCLGNRLAGGQISQEMDSSSALTLTQAMPQTSPTLTGEPLEILSL